MVRFLDLPRELRDAIYTELLLSCRPSPSLKNTQSATGWCRVREPEGPWENGCLIASQSTPPTCASFLACNRQINEELMQIIARANRKWGLAACMDCVEIDGTHYFTWLSLPLVRTKKNKSPRNGDEDRHVWLSGFLSSWASLFLGGGTYHHVVGNVAKTPAYTTSIEQLRIDIRLFTPAKTGGLPPHDQTAWEICAVLKHIFEQGPDPIHRSRKVAFIDEVVLNLLPACLLGNTSQTSSPDGSNDMDHDIYFKPESPIVIISHELVNIWQKIWTANDFNTVDYQARYYRMLLEKINRVRVCVDGKTFKTRELAVELERGRAEMRRIERR
ncbi:hypothetical protein AA0114_g1216 [Alternaria tenuissima]|uniref:F-box domain-containing protein n=1 Tax=Alternaria tenuissima TaxID=119927 RepID=A0A4Q4MUJ9_9PLEO|nr:hypothetical protein AA0114_g1216 [Alternaria tenuissima]